MHDRIASKCSDEEKQSFILSAAGLAGYAQIRPRTGSWNNNAAESADVWNELLEKISALIYSKLGDRKHKGWSSSTLFHLQVFKYMKTGENVSWRSCEQNIAEILNHKNQYAIISTRDFPGGSWNEYLVWLNPYDFGTGQRGEVETWIDKLQYPSDTIERKRTIEAIEEWGEKLKEGIARLPEDEVQRGKNSRRQNQNYILNWMIEKLPCVALFSTDNCCVRVNVLSLEYPGAMYQDRYTRWSVYQEMDKVNKTYGVQRFYTIVNAGYAQVSVENEPSSMYFLMKGKFSRMGKRYLLFPLKGELIGSLQEWTRDMDINNKKSSWYKLFLPIFAFADHVKARCALWEKHNSEKTEHKEYSAEVERILNEQIQGKEAIAYTEIMQCLAEIVVPMIPNDSVDENDTDWEDNLFFKNGHDVREKILDALLVYLYEKADPAAEQWIRKHLVPRYSYILHGSIKNNEEEKEKIRNRLMQECGLIQSENNMEQVCAWKNMISYISKKQEFSRLSEEECNGIYRQYISDIVDVLFFVYQRRLQKILTEDIGLAEYNDFIF